MIYLYVLIYKAISLASGLVVIFLGYKLFLKGIFNESGDIEGTWKNSKLVVKKAAPGTYFVLFGSMIIALTVFKGYSNEEQILGNRLMPEEQKSTHSATKRNSFEQKTNNPQLPDSIKIR